MLKDRRNPAEQVYLQWFQFSENNFLKYYCFAVSIQGGFVKYLDASRCSLMYAGPDYIHYCKDNFEWTSQAVINSDMSSFIPLDVSRYYDCAMNELDLII